jgi:hypothetical protein
MLPQLMKLSRVGPTSPPCGRNRVGMVNVCGRILLRQTDRRRISPMRSVAQPAVQTFGGLGMYSDVMQGAKIGAVEEQRQHKRK